MGEKRFRASESVPPGAARLRLEARTTHIFFHPDYTVGYGI